MSLTPWLAVALALTLVPPAPVPSAAKIWSRDGIVAAERSAATARTAGWAVRPVAGPVLREFDPPATRFGAGHRGVDLRAAAGEPVVAAMGGTVTFAGRVAGVSWITVDHGGGLDTTYGPIQPRLAGAGDVVAPGEWLGFVAAGAKHLDWGARLHDAYIDPLGLLGGWETYLTTAEDMEGLPALGGAATLAGGGAAPGRMAMPAAGVLTSGFGMRTHPVTGEHRLHAGLDIAAPAGTPVRAAAAGVVTFAGSLSGYGTTVTIDHGGGVSTLYAHQSSMAVRPGEPVAAGEVVGKVGSTGLSTGPHLHFEVRHNGSPQDPAGWLHR
jgi:murein DD-endopeptidase MepM/ murein hydrolase activator NlpD